MSRTRTRSNAIVLLVFAAVCVIAVEWLALNIGQPNPTSAAYSIHAVFSDADGVPGNADVRVAGVVVGHVTDVGGDARLPGLSVVTMSLTDPTAQPVYTNGTATVRPKTLLGEKYVDLTVGGPGGGQALASGGYLPVSSASKSVDTDEILNALDAATRQNLQQVLSALDTATTSRAGDVQAILPQLTTAVENLGPVAQVYAQDSPQLDHILVQLDTTLRTLADEHTQLGGLLANGNIALSAVAAKDQALVATLQGASTVSDELNAAMAPAVTSERQAVQLLAPALSSLNGLLNQVVAPQAACGGSPCGIDQVLTGTVLGQVHFPNDLLNVSSQTGEQVTNLWASMFGFPQSGFAANGTSDPAKSTQGASHNALNLSLSLHCDTLQFEAGSILRSFPLGQQVINQLTPLCNKLTGSTPGA